MTNSNSQPSLLDEILAPYTFDAEGYPQTIELEDGRCVSYQELELMDKE